jgi:hypothetical protein
MRGEGKLSLSCHPERAKLSIVVVIPSERSESRDLYRRRSVQKSENCLGPATTR